MIAALFFASALGCLGEETVPLGGSFIAIEPPAPGKRACIYYRTPDEPWAIYMITFDYRLSGARCKAVHPWLEFGRTEIPDGTYCPPDPMRLNRVEVNVR